MSYNSSNIVLIGVPGAGKTTLSQSLQKTLKAEKIKFNIFQETDHPQFEPALQKVIEVNKVYSDTKDTDQETEKVIAQLKEARIGLNQVFRDITDNITANKDQDTVNIIDAAIGVESFYDHAYYPKVFGQVSNVLEDIVFATYQQLTQSRKTLFIICQPNNYQDVQNGINIRSRTLPERTGEYSWLFNDGKHARLNNQLELKLYPVVKEHFNFELYSWDAQNPKSYDDTDLFSSGIINKHCK